MGKTTKKNKKVNKKSNTMKNTFNAKKILLKKRRI